MPLYAPLAYSGESLQEKVLHAAPPKAITAFTLTDQNGRAFQLSQLKGHPVLMFFGFTNCPDVCPAQLSQLAAVVRRKHAVLRNTRVVMISVDGDRDTPQVMKNYLSHLPPGFIGLTGSPKTAASIAAQFAAVFFKGLPSDSKGNYQVQHTSQIYLLDKAGRLRTTLFDASTETLAREASQGNP